MTSTTETRARGRVKTLMTTLLYERGRALSTWATHESRADDDAPAWVLGSVEQPTVAMMRTAKTEQAFSADERLETPTSLTLQSESSSRGINVLGFTRVVVTLEDMERVPSFEDYATVVMSTDLRPCAGAIDAGNRQGFMNGDGGVHSGFVPERDSSRPRPSLKSHTT